jgi:uncharacterized protein DUF4386
MAGFAFLFYIAVGITSMILSSRAIRGGGIVAQLASIAQHVTEMRVIVVLTLLASFSALLLGVTLYAITRDQDPDLANLALICRVVEGVNGAVSVRQTLGVLWLATTAGAAAPDPVSAQALGAFFLRGDPTISATFFAVGSTLFTWLLLRGRMIPVPLAWLGLIPSLVFVLGLPAQFLGFFTGGFFTGPIGWLGWMPLLVFEVTLASWFLIKGVAAPAPR